MDMLVGEKGVKYGLQVRQPPKKTAPPPKKANIFGDDESDDEPNVEQQIARQAERKQQDKKVAAMHASALAEDAAVFDYDAHYDSIQESRAQPKREEKMQRQSRYIAGLLEKAEERKREQDILFERKLAKDREAEDYLFGDKEKFVTSAYRKKLEETAKWQEEEQKRKEMEEQNAVEKKGHMGDFYRNLLRNNVAFGTSTTAAAVGSGSNKAEVDKGSHVGRQEAERPAGREPMPRDEHRPPPPAAAGPSQREEKAAAPPSDRPHVIQEQMDQGQQSAREEQTEPAPAAGGQRRNREDAVAAARERYLARKRKAGDTQ